MTTQTAVNIALKPRASSKWAMRRRALQSLTIAMDVARTGAQPVRLIRGFRSRSVFLLFDDGSQAAISVSSDYSEVVVKHARGRQRTSESTTQPVGLSVDRISVARAVSSADLATRVLYRLNERSRQKAGVKPDLPYVALGTF